MQNGVEDSFKHVMDDCQGNSWEPRLDDWMEHCLEIHWQNILENPMDHLMEKMQEDDSDDSQEHVTQNSLKNLMEDPPRMGHGWITRCISGDRSWKKPWRIAWSQA